MWDQIIKSGEVAAAIAAIIALLGMLGVAIRWCIKVGKGVARILHQVENNGGKSLKDKVESALAEVKTNTEITRKTDAKVDWMIKELVGRSPSFEHIAQKMQEEQDRI